MSDFDFVDFPRRVNTRYLTNLHNRNGQFSGVISLDIAAVDRVYPEAVQYHLIRRRA